jgi:GT2 family glycosyltransferase
MYLGMVEIHAMTPPLVSVCIANYNGIHVLADCIGSVLSQQGDLTVEIIIHDDASTDDSLTWLAEHYPPSQYSSIDVIESSENVGFCVANNRMAEKATGDYLLLLNNDAALAPDALTTLLAAARDQNPRGILTLPQIDWETGTLVDRGCLLDPFYNPVPNLDTMRRDVAMVIGACLWLPRALWNKLGGFPAWFESIAEDMLICCQARLAGYPVQATARSYYLHRQGLAFGGNRASGKQLSTTYRRRRLSERNKTYVMVLCTPPWLIAISLPVHLLFISLEGILLTLIKREPRLWKEIYGGVFRSLYRESKKLRAERNQVQRSRDSSNKVYCAAFIVMPRKLLMLLRYGLPRVS